MGNPLVDISLKPKKQASQIIGGIVYQQPSSTPSSPSGGGGQPTTTITEPIPKEPSQTLFGDTIPPLTPYNQPPTQTGTISLQYGQSVQVTYIDKSGNTKTFLTHSQNIMKNQENITHKGGYIINVSGPQGTIWSQPVQKYEKTANLPRYTTEKTSGIEPIPETEVKPGKYYVPGKGFVVLTPEKAKEINIQNIEKNYFKTYTPEEFERKTYNIMVEANKNYQELKKQSKDIFNPLSPMFSKNVIVTSEINGKTTTETMPYPMYALRMMQLTKEVEKNYLSTKNFYEKTSVDVSEWHPSTKIKQDVRTGEFKIEFPYQGAEKYTSYKKLLETNPGQAAALGWGGGGYGNVDIMIYKMMGKNEKALEKQIQQLSSYDIMKETLAKGDVGEFSKQYWGSWWSSPATQITTTYAVGAGVGVPYGYAEGYYLESMQMAKLARLQQIGMGMGIALTAPTVKEIGADIASGDIGKAMGETNLFFASLGSGVKGFETGKAYGYIHGSYKGQTQYYKNLYKSGKINFEEYTIGLEAHKARVDVLKDKEFKNLVESAEKERQPSSFEKVRALERQSEIVQEFVPTQMKTKNLGKGEIYGGFVSGKESTSDIDLALAAKSTVQLKYNVNKALGGNLRDWADIHRVQGVNELAGDVGTVVEQSRMVGGYKYKGILEGFKRISGSSLKPEKLGRLKDIPESVRYLYEDIIKGKPISKEFELKTIRFKEAYTKLGSLDEKNPFVLTQEQAGSIYGSSFTEKFWKWRVKTLEKVTPESLLEKKFQSIYDPEYTKLLEKTNINIIPEEIASAEGFKGITWLPRGRGKYTFEPDIGISSSQLSNESVFRQMVKEELYHHFYPRTPEHIIHGGVYTAVDLNKVWGKMGYNITDLFYEGKPIHPLGKITELVAKIPGPTKFPHTQIDTYVGKLKLSTAIKNFEASKTPTIKTPYYPPSISSSFSTNIPISIPASISKRLPSQKTKTISLVSLSTTIIPIKTISLKLISPSKTFPSIITTSTIATPSKTSISTNISNISTKTSSITKSPPSPYSISKSISTSYNPSIVPSVSLSAYGRGQRGSEFSLFSERKRKRGIKIYNPLRSMFKKMEARIKL